MAQIRSMAHRRPPSRVLTSNAASSQPTCSATAGGCCLRRRLRAAAYVRALPRSSTVLARQPVHMGMRGWPFPARAALPRGRCSCIAAWDTQVRRSSSGQSCVAVARPSRAPPSEAPPAGRGGLARFTCGWHSLSEGNLAAIWPRAEPPPLASAGTSWWAGAGPSDQIHPPQASHRPSLCCRAPCSSCAPLSAPPLLRPLLRTPRTPITKPHPAPAPNPPLCPARAPIGALAASPSAHIRRRAAMACAPTHVHATQAHRRPAWQSRPRRDRGARRARCGARPSRACAPPSLRRARTAAAAGRRNGRRSPPRRTREHRRRVERGRVGCYGAARPRRSLRAAAWRLVKQPRQPSPFIRPE